MKTGRGGNAAIFSCFRFVFLGQRQASQCLAEGGLTGLTFKAAHYFIHLGTQKNKQQDNDACPLTVEEGQSRDCHTGH